MAKELWRISGLLELLEEVAAAVGGINGVHIVDDLDEAAKVLKNYSTGPILLCMTPSGTLSFNDHGAQGMDYSPRLLVVSTKDKSVLAEFHAMLEEQMEKGVDIGKELRRLQNVDPSENRVIVGDFDLNEVDFSYVRILADDWAGVEMSFGLTDLSISSI